MPTNIVQDDAWKKEYLDGLMDQAHARKLEIENHRGQIKSKYAGVDRDADPETMARFQTLDRESKGLDDAINHVLNASEDNVPYTYKEHYRQKYLKQPETQGPQQPASPETGSVWQHPAHLLGHGLLGAKEFASLPIRAVESLTGTQKEEGGGYWSEPYSFKRMIEKHREQLEAADRAKNLDPSATGSQVAEALGGAAIPIGPTLKGGQLLMNTLKGAGFTAGAYGAERVARDEPWTAEGLGTSAAAGGVMGGVLGKLFGRGKVPTKGAEGGPIPSTTEPIPKPTPPKQLPAPGEGIIYGEAPLRQLPAPEAPAPPSRYTQMREAIQNKPVGEMSQDERAFLLFQRGKTNPPPNAAGVREDIGVVPTKTRSLKDVLGIKPPEPTPVAQGEIIEAKGRVIPEEPSIKEVAVANAKKASGKAKLLTPEEAINMAKQMDLEKDTMAKEATLRDVISGKTDVSKVPMKRAKRQEGTVSIESKLQGPEYVKGPDGKYHLTKKGKFAVSRTREDHKQAAIDYANEKGFEPPPKSEAPTPAVEGEVGAPSQVSPGSFRIDQPFAGIVNVKDGNIEHLKTYAEAQEVDFQHRLYFEPNAAEKLDAGEAAFFFIDNKGKLNFEWSTGTGVSPTIKESVEQQLAAKGLSGKVEPMRPAASGKIVESKPEKVLPIAKEVPIEKPQMELPLKRTEDFIKEQGYTVREREPFPGEKEYDLLDPKSGSVVARGDRAQLTSALGNLPSAKGVKLHSFPGDIEEFGTMFKGALRKAGARVPEGVEVENMPHRAGVANTLLRPFETPEFNVRKSESGRTITDAGREADRQIGRRVRDLITEEVVPGKEYRPTKLSSYYSASAGIRDPVNKVLVLGDKTGTVYTPEQLLKHGLSTDQVSMYQGVRESLDKVVKWIKEIGPEHAEFDSRKIEGYIPRVWKGDWEIFVNGNKYLKPKTETSSFSTLSEAAAEAHSVKAASKDAKISIRFFPDPEYLSSRGLADARVIARLKSNLERMGHMDSATIDEAFKMGKSVKGFAKHLLERKDAVGYETQDLDKVLNSYFYQAARRIEMQKVKNVAESVLKEHKADLSAGQVQYMQEYVERVAGKPAWDQIAIHQFVQDTPIGKWIDPIRGGKLISSGRELVTHLTLGFGNVGWAMINLDGLTRHVWPLLAKEGKMVGAVSPFASEKYMLKGIEGFFKDKGLRQMLAHHGVIDIQLMSEPTPKIGHEFGKGAWTPERISMMLGTATEEFSRGVAAIARYHMAIDHGATSDQAMQAAARFVEQTLGRYSRGGRPPAFTGAIGSTVGLFKTYMSVMLQNGWRALESKDIGTITRYITGAVGVSGILGLVPGIEDLDSALTKHTGWSPIETIEKNLPPAVATGLFSLAGVDISRRAGIPEIIPNDARGWAGPVVGRFSSTIADIANGEYGEAILDMLPNSIRNVVAVARGYKEGKVIGRLDKPTYDVTPKEAVLHAVGLTPSKEAAESRLYQRNVNKEAYREDTLDSLTRKIAQGRASESDYAKFAELGGKSRRIRNEQRRESQTMIERQYKHLPKILRREQPAS